MKQVVRSEILPLGEYEQVRERFRERVIAEKRDRRVSLGQHMSVVFENRDTVLFQIQEMLRAERITSEPAIMHEIDTYNELIPGEDQLSMTLFIEVVDRQARDELLEACAGMERHLWLEVAGERLPARASARDGQLPHRTTAVQYYTISLGDVASRIRAGESLDMHLVLDHPAYAARAALGPRVVAQLRSDLTWHAS